MDERELRLECLRLAAVGGGDYAKVLDVAGRYANFVEGSGVPNGLETVAVQADEVAPVN